MNVFCRNDARERYYSLIASARSKCRRRGTFRYYEEHHIIPRSLGGSNCATNKVLLTAKEHFVCHKLLVLMTKGENRRKMSYALWTMSNGRANSHQTARKPRAYSKAKRLMRDALSEDRKGRSYEERYGKKRAAEIRRKISYKHIGRVFSEETRKLLSEAKTGVKFSEEARANMRAERATRPKLKCPTCKGLFDAGNFSRYHGDSCQEYQENRACVGCSCLFTVYRHVKQRYCSSPCAKKNSPLIGKHSRK